MPQDFKRRFAAAACAVALVGGVAPAAMADEATPTANSATTRFVGEETNTWGAFPGAAGIEVRTEINVDGEWRTSRTGTTDDAGRFVLPLSYGTNSAGTYRYRVAGIQEDGSVQRTDEFSLTRWARPSANAASSKRVGEATNTWGSAPAVAGDTVWTEVRVGSEWRRSQERVASETGGYAIPLTYGASTPGTYEFRVASRFPDGRVARSNTISLTRFGAPTAQAASSSPVGQRANVWGSFPGSGSISVWTEVRLPSGAWSRSASGTTTDSGGYTLPLTYGADTAGTYRWRVAGRQADGRVVRTGEFSQTRTPVGFDYSYCSRAGSAEAGLTSTAVRVMRATCNRYTDVSTFLGFRGSAGSYHSEGRAIDVMVSGARGWEIAHWLRANAVELGVTEVIYERRIWTLQRSGDGWRWMSSRGNATADHYDHVHISTR